MLKTAPFCRGQDLSCSLAQKVGLFFGRLILTCVLSPAQLHLGQLKLTLEQLGERVAGLVYS
jgi:hypothetical protein